jgi:multiple sugar transport system substrate-binding protein
MMPLPAFPGNQGAAALGGWQLGISRFSSKPDLAWRFVSFMTASEMQKRVALATGRAPTRSALYTDPELLAAIPQLESLLQTFKQAVPRPTTPVYIPLSNIMQRYFSSVLALSDADLRARAALAARDMNRLLELLRERGAP